jgi:hypothetical protein
MPNLFLGSTPSDMFYETPSTIRTPRTPYSQASNTPVSPSGGTEALGHTSQQPQQNDFGTSQVSEHLSQVNIFGGSIQPSQPPIITANMNQANQPFPLDPMASNEASVIAQHTSMEHSQPWSVLMSYYDQSNDPRSSLGQKLNADSS